MKTLELPIGRVAKIPVSKGRVFLRPPVVTPGSYFLADDERDIVQVDRADLSVRGRAPAKGHWIYGAVGEYLLLSRRRRLRVQRGLGDVVWEQEIPPSTWMIWRDRVLVDSPRLALINVETGEREELGEVGDGIAFGTTVGDVLMFRREGAEAVEHAFDLVARKMLWSRNLFADIELRFDLRGEERALGRVVGGAGSFVGYYADHIFGFSMRDGAVQWKARGWVPSSAIGVQAGRVYAWACDREANYAARLVCLDEVTGECVYSRAMKEYKEPQLDRGALVLTGVIAGDYFLVVSKGRGFLALFRLSDGDLVWFYEDKHELYRPVVADNRILVTSSDGKLLVFDGHSKV